MGSGNEDSNLSFVREECLLLEVSLTGYREGTSTCPLLEKSVLYLRYAVTLGIGKVLQLVLC